MEITQAQYEHIAHLLPVQRGNVKVPNRQVLNALLYMLENGCKWRALPPQYGKWGTLYARMHRWAKTGVLDRVFAALRTEGIINDAVVVASLDSTTVKAHPNATGALKKTGRRPLAGLVVD